MELPVSLSEALLTPVAVLSDSHHRKGEKNSDKGLIILSKGFQQDTEGVFRGVDSLKTISNEAKLAQAEGSGR